MSGNRSRIPARERPLISLRSRTRVASKCFLPSWWFSMLTVSLDPGSVRAKAYSKSMAMNGETWNTFSRRQRKSVRT